jgi:hypothetical protein
MREPLDRGPAEQRSEAAATTQIARSLGSLWQRVAGTRPRSTSIEMGTDTIRCVIEEGAPDSAPGEHDETLESARFRHDASAAVRRATGRRVVAFIAERDGQTGTSRQTFILDRPRERS